MKKNKSKAKKALSAILSVVAVVVVFSIVNSIITGSDSDIPSSKDTSGSQQTEEVKDDERVLYEDDNFKISYIDITDPNSGLTMYIMNLKLENKSEKSVLISLEETYINDTQVQFLGGNLSFDGTLPGKKSICSFSFGYDKLGIKSIEDIKNIEFKIELTDTDFSEVYLETDTIKIAL